jgi:hypothetical protein
MAESGDVTVSSLPDRAGRPREALDYPYARQQELLRQTRQAVTEVAATRTRAALRESQLRRAAGRLRLAARQAVIAGREDLAGQALAERAATLARADDLMAGQAALRADEVRLSAAVRGLQTQIAAFRRHQEMLRARLPGGPAGAGPGPALRAVCAEMDQVDLAAGRAEDTMARLRARVGALRQLLTPAATPSRLPSVSAPRPAVTPP